MFYSSSGWRIMLVRSAFDLLCLPRKRCFGVELFSLLAFFRSQYGHGERFYDVYETKIVSDDFLIFRPADTHNNHHNKLLPFVDKMFVIVCVCAPSSYQFEWGMSHGRGHVIL